MTSSSFLQLTQNPEQKIPAEYALELTSYIVKLESNNLPVIFSSEHLALLMGVSPLLLQNIIENSGDYYRVFFIRKKMGGHRQIMAPDDRLKYIQTWIKYNILDKIASHSNTHGFVSEKSISTNAQFHLKKEIILNIDLYRFFETITLKRVYGLLHSLGYAKNLAYNMSYLLCTSPKGSYWKTLYDEGIIKPSTDPVHQFILPQGSPASPVITNLICHRLDVRFQGLAEKLNCNYTRYADDITFSGNRENIPSINTIRKIISDEGFYINERKVKYVPNSKRQLVTGVVVNEKLKVIKSMTKMVNQHLHFCVKYGVQNHLEVLQKKEGKRKSNYKQWLLGNISFIYSIEKDKGNKMFEKFKLINWEL